MITYTWLEFRARFSSILSWGVGIAVYMALVLALFPSLSEQLGQLDVSGIEIYQAFGVTSNFASFEGYYTVYVINYLPILAGVFGVISGNGALAGEEEQGTLELTVALPLRRWHIVLAKVAAIGLALFLVLLINYGAILIALLYIEQQMTINLGRVHIWQSVLGMWPLVFFFALLGLWLGAYLPRRRWALGIGMLLLIGSWLVNNLALSNDQLQPITPWLPFHYLTTDVTQGWALSDNLTLLGAAGVLLLLTLFSFQRRNLMTGAWPWQRARVS